MMSRVPTMIAPASSEPFEPTTPRVARRTRRSGVAPRDLGGRLRGRGRPPHLLEVLRQPRSIARLHPVEQGLDEVAEDVDEDDQQGEDQGDRLDH